MEEGEGLERFPTEVPKRLYIKAVIVYPSVSNLSIWNLGTTRQEGGKEREERKQENLKKKNKGSF